MLRHLFNSWHWHNRYSVGTHFFTDWQGDETVTFVPDYQYIYLITSIAATYTPNAATGSNYLQAKLMQEATPLLRATHATACNNSLTNRIYLMRDVDILFARSPDNAQHGKLSPDFILYEGRHLQISQINPAALPTWSDTVITFRKWRRP